MSKITAGEVKKLRDLTGAGMLDSKRALEESGGNLKKAVELFRKRGQLKAVKKSERTTGQGVVDAYIHGEGRIGVLLEVNCETDFVARNKEFKTLVHDLALHIAALAPLYISRDDVPAEVISKEKDIYAEGARTQGKGAGVIEKIVSGRVEKFYQEVCLLEQSFVRDQDITVQELINQKIAVLGENIRVQRFARYVLGE